MGRHEEAIGEIQLAQELDPLSLVAKLCAASTFYLARMYDQAIERCQRLLEMDPNFIPTHSYLGSAYLQKGKYEDAISEFQMALTLSSRSPVYLARLGHAYAIAGRKGEARKILKELKELAKQQYIPSLSIALIHTGLDEKDQALDWLERADEERYWRVLNIKVDPKFEILHSEQKFIALLKKMGLDK